MRLDSLLSRPDSCPTNGVHLSDHPALASVALTPGLILASVLSRGKRGSRRITSYGKSPCREGGSKVLNLAVH